MSNAEKYLNVFKEIFGETYSEFGEEFTFSSVEEWDSLVHMDLIAALEETFDVMFKTEDLLNYESYENGKKILERYGIQF